jgi:hypothetical protein
VKALDSINGSSGSGVYAVVINKSGAPVVSSGNVSGQAGVPLAFTVSTSDANALALSLAGAPSGMAISSSGTVSWAAPVAGVYSVSVVAKDSKTSLVGTGNYLVSIGAAGAPVIAGSGLTVKTGTPLSGTIQISDAASSVVGVGIGGAPLGMSFVANGGLNNFTVSWSKPVAGVYVLQVSAVDSAGNATSALLQVIVSN